MSTPEQKPQPAAGPKCSRTVYVVLAIFLGSLGIHNFVAGRTGFGVVQLLLGTVGFFLMGLGPVVAWIWAIGEAITVREDGRGVPFTSCGNDAGARTERTFAEQYREAA